MTEAQHQAEVIKWSQRSDILERYPEVKLLFHIPNGGGRSPQTAHLMKLTGVKAGVPDLCLPVARGKWHALYIEMKTKTGQASPEQKRWHRDLMEQWNLAMVCKGWEAAVSTIEAYLEGRL